jgi:hypothetical protein
MITRQEIQPAEYNPYYKGYLEGTEAGCTIQQALEHGLEQSVRLLTTMDADLSYRYEPGKWSIGQVLQHCIDTERVFAYRALRFMRGDKTALSGFDQDIFSSDFSDFAFAKAELLNSLVTTRKATLQLFNEVCDDFLKRTGVANGNEMTARAIPFIIVGHQAHHERVIVSQYLI